jgi:hypothetical protein
MTDSQTTPQRRRCVAVVLKRDTLRYTGRSKSGFEMHYTKTQCARAATCANTLCRQHAAIPNQRILERPYHVYC